MEGKSLKSTTLQDAVYRELFEDIVTGTLPPGSKINIRKIAEQYDVSMQPVREAIRRLEAEKMLTIRNRSMVINKMSREEIDQSFFVYKSNIRLAFEIAAEKREEDDLPRLKKHLESIKAAETKMEFFNAARNLWLSVVRSAGNKMLYDVITFILLRMSPYIILTVVLIKKPELEKLIKHYEDLFKAMEQRDRKTIKRLAGNAVDIIHKNTLSAFTHKEELQVKDYLELIDMYKKTDFEEKP